MEMANTTHWNKTHFQSNLESNPKKINGVGLLWDPKSPKVA